MTPTTPPTIAPMRVAVWLDVLVMELALAPALPVGAELAEEDAPALEEVLFVGDELGRCENVRWDLPVVPC